MRLRLEIDLEYDSKTMHGDDSESIEWFFKNVLKEKKGDLLLLCKKDHVKIHRRFSNARLRTMTIEHLK